jgi:hypothetical protein
MQRPENQALPGIKRDKNPLPAESRVQVNGAYADHMADKTQKWDKVEDEVDGNVAIRDSNARH